MTIAIRSMTADDWADVVGTRERVGRMAYGPYAGQWRDVILIERRSDSTG